jgi:hypothetical protein
MPNRIAHTHGCSNRKTNARRSETSAGDNDKVRDLLRADPSIGERPTRGLFGKCRRVQVKRAHPFGGCHREDICKR